jgi:hypothetical protein
MIDSIAVSSIAIPVDGGSELVQTSYTEAT